MNVVFRINGREAIPVRAIPFVAETTLSADILVRGLLHLDPIHPLSVLSAYKLLDYGVTFKMEHLEWRRFAINLQALSDRLARQERTGELTLAEATARWKRESVRVLPAGVFVWKDEFQSEHSRRFRRLSDDEVVANRAHSIEATTELIASPDDSCTAELMAANGMPENWREKLQRNIDERAAEEPFNPRQFFVYAPNWSSAKASDSPVDVTYDPMIDRDEADAVAEGFVALLTDNQTNENAPMPHAEGGGELVQMLAKWFDKSLSDLPGTQRRYVDMYIPNWSESSAVERRACAIAADSKAQESNAERIARATREHEGLVPDRWEQRAMQNGFGKATRESAGDRHCEAKLGEVKLSDERCRDLAQMPVLQIAEWVELTGVGVGDRGPFRIALDSVSFVKWDEKDLKDWPSEHQVDMLRENLHEPLAFPCTPKRLLAFIDSELCSIHGCFWVPAAFARAVTNRTKPCTAQGSDWTEAARAIADKFFDHDTENKCRDSLAGYSARVMDELQKQEVHGPRGRIDNKSTVQREALQGEKWWKRKKK